MAGKNNTCADLLSRGKSNTDNGCGPNEEDIEIDRPDNSLRIEALNPTKFNPKNFASCDLPIPEASSLPRRMEMDIDMQKEQDRDENITSIKEQLEKGHGDKSHLKRYLVINDLLYYVSAIEDDPSPRLYVPEKFKQIVVTQYHDANGYMGIDKTFEAIKLKYYWPNLYREITECIGKCITCQSRTMKAQKPALQETEIPPYPFAKVSMDLSGPYPTTLSGNKYIIGFVDHFSGWPEAYAVPDKSAETVAHLILEEIFPRFGCPLQIVTDNGTENINKVVSETLSALGINHVRTSFYHPQSNARVERFHRTLHDVLAKKLNDNVTTWDLYLNQTLAAIRFYICESSKFSPYFLLYNRDVVLPVDNLLRPRRKYAGDEEHKTALQQQHKAFVLVHKNMKKAKKDRPDMPTGAVNKIKVGDPVYYRFHQRKSKLQNRWKPFYRVIEQTSPVTYIIRNQLDGSTTRAHAEHLRIANLDDWEIPKDTEGRPRRKQHNVISLSSESTSDEEVQGSKDPMSRITKRYRQERSDSDSENDVPLAQLAKRLSARRRDSIDNSTEDNGSSESSDNDNVSVNEVKETRQLTPDDKVKKLFEAVAGLL
ncbi:uncharacterized protein K02A2.6-like [Haliotis rufescens]|uniref:uncharacterized protein K02A2.6-like n=1 Tax=Haliotis rufescens TaxID=6454 RepID=UPI00201EE317|nr:uncharacterized protein K02A2.6-like [Haliotis rufescens]